MKKTINTEKYKCVGFICNTVNQKLRNANFNCGYANGYVAIPPNHPLPEVDYNMIDIEIHGGLTFSELVDSTFLKNFISAEFIDGKVPDKYWVLGFDTMHVGDTLDSCPREYVIDEVNKLKKILENWE